VNQSHGPYYAIIEWFARNAVAANLLMIILLAGGLYSVATIKKESQPPIDTNFVTVSMPFLGSSPEDVEEGILVKIEERGAGVVAPFRSKSGPVTTFPRS